MHVHDSKCFTETVFPRKIFTKPKQILSNTSFLTPPKIIKHIKKLNLAWPQKLTHNHMYIV